jgi:hypothetical protein
MNESVKPDSQAPQVDQSVGLSIWLQMNWPATKTHGRGK